MIRRLSNLSNTFCGEKSLTDEASSKRTQHFNAKRSLKLHYLHLFYTKYSQNFRKITI